MLAPMISSRENTATTSDSKLLCSYSEKGLCVYIAPFLLELNHFPVLATCVEGHYTTYCTPGTTCIYCTCTCMFSRHVLEFTNRGYP